MNICFFMGKIFGDIKFDFVLNGSKDSIVIFKIRLLNDSVIKVIAYDEIADYCYSTLEKDDIIFVEGSLNSNLSIVAKRIHKNESIY